MLGHEVSPRFILIVIAVVTHIPQRKNTGYAGAGPPSLDHSVLSLLTHDSAVWLGSDYTITEDDSPVGQGPWTSKSLPE
jgi:hypothetical protein